MQKVRLSSALFAPRRAASSSAWLICGFHRSEHIIRFPEFGKKHLNTFRREGQAEKAGASLTIVNASRVARAIDTSDLQSS
jgi:hypothetical protein